MLTQVGSTQTYIFSYRRSTQVGSVNYVDIEMEELLNIGLWNYVDRRFSYSSQETKAS